MDTFNPELMTHSFTSDMTFRNSFEKFKCFRIMDNEGKIVTPGWEDKIDDKLLLKMHEKMLMMNEAD